MSNELRLTQHDPLTHIGSAVLGAKIPAITIRLFLLSVRKMKEFSKTPHLRPCKLCSRTSLKKSRSTGMRKANVRVDDIW